MKASDAFLFAFENLSSRRLRTGLSWSVSTAMPQRSAISFVAEVIGV